MSVPVAPQPVGAVPRAVLSIFDFDGTLFRSPSPSEALKAKYGPDITMPVFAGGMGWFQNVETLAAPYVPEKIALNDDTWFIPATVEAYLAAKKDGHITAILTGREEYFRNRITQLTTDAGMVFDHIFLKPDAKGGTVAFKLNVFAEMIAKYQPSQIVYYEDREEQGQKIQEAFDLLKSGKRPHPRNDPLPASLIPFAQNFKMIMIPDKDRPFAPEVEAEVVARILKSVENFNRRRSINTRKWPR